MAVARRECGQIPCTLGPPIRLRRVRVGGTRLLCDGLIAAAAIDDQGQLASGGLVSVGSVRAFVPWAP